MGTQLQRPFQRAHIGVRLVPPDSHGHITGDNPGFGFGDWGLLSMMGPLEGCIGVQDFPKNKGLIVLTLEIGAFAGLQPDMLIIRLWNHAIRSFRRLSSGFSFLNLPCEFLFLGCFPILLRSLFGKI